MRREIAWGSRVGEGYLLATSRRLDLRGESRSAAVEYSPQANLTEASWD